MHYTNIAQASGKILYRGIERGKHVTRRVPFAPKHYIKSASESKTTHYCFDGTPLTEISKKSIVEGREFLKSFDNVYGMDNYVYQFISDNYQDDIEFDTSKIRVYNIDIEVYAEEFPNPANADHPVTAITIYNSINQTYYLFGLGDEYEISRDDVKALMFTDEKKLLETFLKFWSIAYPDIVTGWNIDGFDIPYLYNRLVKLFDEKTARKLSPWNIIRDKQVFKFNQPQTQYTILGIANLDYIDLYKKYTYTDQESYSLDHIAYVELGERKLSYEEAGSLHNLYVTDKQKYFDYNIRDVELVQKIDDKNKFIDIVITVAYYAKINFNDVTSPVKTWDVLIYNYLRHKGYIIPPKAHSSKTEMIEGAYVKEPILGKHEWIMSFDLASLYPSLIRQFNMGMDTHLKDHNFDLSNVNVSNLLDQNFNTDFLLENELVLTPNGQLFSKDTKSFLSVLMEDLYIKRKNWKKQMLQAENQLEHVEKNSEEYNTLNREVSKFTAFQMAAKILLNSGYGATSNQYFRYYRDEIAEAITTSGKLIIKYAEKSFNEYLQKIMGDTKDRVVALDTDSNYLVLDDLVKKGIPDETDPNKIVDFLDRIGRKKLEPFISAKFQELHDYLNCAQQLMIMEREAIADAAIWTAKKRYFMRVWDNEGVRYTVPKMKIKGMEAIKSSTPEICRNQMKHIFGQMLEHSEDVVLDQIEEFKKKWFTLPAHEIAFPSSINDLSKYDNDEQFVPKGTPIHARGSLIHNWSLDKCSGKVDRIRNGDKIKYIYLNEPNTLRSYVVSFKGFLPKEFKADEYIDYETMFKKAFIKPLESVLGQINWNTEKVANFGNLI